MSSKISLNIYLKAGFIVAVVLAGIFALNNYVAADCNYQGYCQPCTPYAYQQCFGGHLYWYDSCGNQQQIAQYCQNGCYNNSCFGYNYPSCNYHAYKLCVGNSVYWFDSCGNQQEIVQTCYGANQICQYGQCVYKPSASYMAHYRMACYGNDLYWYDSLGQKNDLYKSCSDSNSCTQDACVSGKCSNIIKCDGLTCAVGSADYNVYCATKNHCGNGICEPALGETTENCVADCKVSGLSGLSVSFLVKQDATSTQWLKTAQVGEGGQLYFMISVANGGNAQVDNIKVSVNIPLEIAMLGNLQLDGAPVSGDIVNRINIGSLAVAGAKTITFEGKTQAFSAQSTKEAIATVSLGEEIKTDTISIIFNPGQAAGAAVSEPTGSALLDFLKRWYLWILVGVVLVFLFVVVFRRLSTNA